MPSLADACSSVKQQIHKFTILPDAEINGQRRPGSVVSAFSEFTFDFLVLENAYVRFRH